jgi:hypothetical protein
MKTIKTTALFILAILLTGRVMAQGDKQLTITLTNPGKPYKVNMHIIEGSIKVVGYDGKDIMIDAEQDTTKSNRNHNNNSNTNSGMRQISAGNNLDLTAEEDNNVVEINSGTSKRATTFVLKIPQGDVTLKVGTVNNGNIIVSNLSGEIEITNVNGAITATGISGSLVATTVNGNVIATFKTIDPKAPMAFSTLNGNVDVTFPADIKANVKLKSDRGEVYSDFDVAIDKTQPKVSKTNEGHMQRISIEDWVYGKINGGGPEVMMKNMQGNIYVRKAK